MDLGGDFQPQSVQANETGRIILIIRLGRVSLHRRNVWIIETDGRLASGSDDVALVQLKSHGARHMLLALVHQGLQCEPLR